MDPMKKYDEKFEKKEKKVKEIASQSREIAKKVVIGFGLYAIGIAFFLMMGNKNAAIDGGIMLIFYMAYLFYKYVKSKNP